MTNHGSQQNTDSSFRPKKMLTERGIKSCTIRPNTTGKGDQSGKEELFWQAKKKNYLPVILLQCGKAWKISPVTSHHPSTLENQQLADLQHPSLPHTYNSDKRRRCAPGLQKEQKKESTRPRRCVTSLPKNLCLPASPHLHTDLQQITGAVRSPLMLQTLHHHPRPKETQNYWT